MATPTRIIIDVDIHPVHSGTYWTVDIAMYDLMRDPNGKVRDAMGPEEDEAFRIDHFSRTEKTRALAQRRAERVKKTYRKAGKRYLASLYQDPIHEHEFVR